MSFVLTSGNGCASGERNQIVEHAVRSETRLAPSREQTASVSWMLPQKADDIFEPQFLNHRSGQRFDKHWQIRGQIRPILVPFTQLQIAPNSFVALSKALPCLMEEESVELGRGHSRDLVSREG
jgi:hypothetical protein